MNKKLKPKRISAESCELVYVHIRRGDHLEYENLNGVPNLKKQYFLQAMDVYKETLQHPVFILVTDDPQWAFKQMHKSFKPYFTGKINGQFQCWSWRHIQDSTTRHSKTLLAWTWQSCPLVITWCCHAEHLDCGETFSQDHQEYFPSISYQVQLVDLWIWGTRCPC